MRIGIRVASSACGRAAMSFSRLARFMIGIAVATSCTMSVAAPYTWSGTATDTWSTAATNWSGAPANPWNSTNGPSNVAVFNTANLNATVSNEVFTNGITFSTTGTLSSGTISLAGTSPTITATGIGVVGSQLAGSNGFTKSGANRLILTSANTLSGTVVLSSGTLEPRNASALGEGTLQIDGGRLSFGTTNNMNVGNAVNVTVDTQIDASNVAVTLSGPITTTGSITFRGLGGASNRFIISDSVTSSNNSSLRFNVDSSQNHVVSGTITTGTGGVYKQSSARLTLSNPNNAFSGGLFQLGSGTLTVGAAGAQGSGPITFGSGGSGEVEFANVDGTIANTITGGGGTGGIRKSGTGTMTLSGENTYAGNTVVSGGYIRVAGATALSSGTVTLSASGATPAGLQLEPGVTINLPLRTAGRSDPTTTGYILRSLGGSTQWQGPIEITSGGGTYGFLSDSGTTTLSGTLTSTVTGTFGARSVFFAGDGDFVVSGPIVKGGPDPIQDLAITKQGAGTLTLSGTSDYTGPTTVSAGRLVIEGVLGQTNLTVTSGGIVGGGGSLGGALTFEENSQFVFEPTKTLTVNGSAVTFASSFGVGDLLGLDASTLESTYTLLDGTALIDQANLDNIGFANRASIGGGKFAYFEPNGGLNLVVVPEPGSVMLVAAAALFFGRRIRSSRRLPG